MMICQKKFGEALIFGLAFSMVSFQGLLLAQTIIPQRLLIYYSWPSLINQTSSIGAASNQFGRYQHVVLGDTLQDPTHPDHANAVAIINHAATRNTKFYGYISIGVSTVNWTIEEIEQRVDQWVAMGVDGILLDEAGYEYLVSRDRQNAVYDYLHGQGLVALINGWNPDDVFGTTVHLLNPLQAPPHILPVDIYLAESYQIEVGQFQDPIFWRAKSVKIRNYQGLFGHQVFSVTTNDAQDLFSSISLRYAWYSSLLDGHAAMGWGQYLFASDDAVVPFRPRPDSIDFGSRFITNVRSTGTRFYRNTDLGQIWIDTATHGFGFRRAVISVVGPNGGEAWTKGQQVSISWMDNLTGSVRIQLYRNGVPIRVIASVVASNGTLDWAVPVNLPTGSGYRVRITSRDHPGSFDESDLEFSISN